MVDLHTHTDQSDGSASPTELVRLAVHTGIETLAITDHDTFAGYDLARQEAERRGLHLLCGIELSTKDPTASVHNAHLLGYFPCCPPAGSFRAWLGELQDSRAERNRRLAERLRQLGVDVRLDEVQRLGKSMTGRPHFARVLIGKGYAASQDEAFERYLDESAPGYVQRREPSIEEAISRISEGGGIACLAHPVRLSNGGRSHAERMIARLAEMGLGAIEAYHSDHDEEVTAWHLGLARRLGLAATGGSDFHGDMKPSIRLGVGRGSLRVPREAVDELRAKATCC